MSWMELSLDTTHEGVDWVCTLVAQTIDINDVYITEYTAINQAQSVTENASHPSWAFTINLYLACDAYLRTRIDKILHLLSPLERTGIATAIQTNIVEDKLTNGNILKPVIHRIGKRFVVLPPDIPYQLETPDQVSLRLNKSFSFGSGFHPATILSLKLIERYVLPGMNTLDLGSGSGILSVAMAKLGATVLALDNDSLAVQATQDAVLCNGVEQQVTVMAGSLGSGSDLGHWMNQETIDHVPTIKPAKSFDLIVANILARVHVALANDFQNALRQTDAHQGLLIASGFTVDHEENVTTAFTQAGLELVDCERLNEWVAFAYRLV
ncbi:[LSU ribosomal protein L11P]-lysine N-methyltransferase [Trichormus variabilis ATCC 29413]|uniref:[LSU ribosomal protein L11P]-lysine N-methyltransferase n=2 Tax=Anabaena variabilis TaxID=264691 RepID=Q3M612_TRIV2|nr:MULTISPECIES: 50S ribosomal protein L11 methyltransferase [Nostocaceae]ABA23574.1 [LSU ribosomal protein L11P]-lysine N-methyltransferase [Trichormus variabilis ATCC 29413]MBC1215495.1 50S ribosomal protein L11 methyltransferase [Trichormus variabilis ARAD]MBC1257790.1 50S ribosomal protein L11 methyltransferase [Trichormus variabilis V5]MBC1269986.1 50S ribosomal protein L11 methyltransferase [Trichormus variabilis FSR]MBC1304806.1 50S ribosomal protein L11 methyltransferase [Trichormus va